MKQKWDIQQEHAAGLAEKRQVNGVTAFDVSAARLEALEAESAAIAALVAAKLAEVRLDQAVGPLTPPCDCPTPAAASQERVARL